MNISGVKNKLTLAIVVIGLGVILWFFYLEVRKIAKQPITSWTQDHFADCAVVLTGGPGRIREGMDMLVQGKIRKLIISGVFPGAGLREIFPLLPFYGSINVEDIILEKRSQTTYGNAQQSLPLLEVLKCRDAVLVTSRLHMHRAYKTFKAIYPANISLYKRSVISNSYKPKIGPLLAESVKSLFYSIWAY